jgi:hypothetical protein
MEAQIFACACQGDKRERYKAKNHYRLSKLEGTNALGSGVM